MLTGVFVEGDSVDADEGARLLPLLGKLRPQVFAAARGQAEPALELSDPLVALLELARLTASPTPCDFSAGMNASTPSPP